MGWVTKVTEYKREMTINVRISVTAITTNAQILTSISSVVRFNFFNLFLQNWCDQILWASLSELASRLLALSCVKIVRILALVAIFFVTTSQQ
jgi:hypothetical protein